MVVVVLEDFAGVVAVDAGVGFTPDSLADSDDASLCAKDTEQLSKTSDPATTAAICANFISFTSRMILVSS